MIKGKNYRMYEVEIRNNGNLLTIPVGANNSEEAIKKVKNKYGYKQRHIIGAN